ncbi:MAG: ABC transporter ATP-binding protein [Steroidobacteraceae bacterium]
MSEAVISARNVGKTMGDRTILRDISVDVAPGDIVGVIGKNGAGKTTLLELLLGFSPATTGVATIFGSNSFRLPASLKRRIGFVPQQDELIDQFTGAQQLSLNASLRGHWDSALIARLAQDWNVPLGRATRLLSPGERQKISILLALGHTPDLLVLDEPASSLDPAARRQFLQQILELTASPSRTVVFSTHIVADLERVANRIWIIREGAVVWQGPLDTLKESVVRLNVHGRRRLPALSGIPDVLSQRIDETRASIVVSRWDVTREAPLARQLDADITVEYLSLEDIFVEFAS